ncbi:MAG: helix-turn-helix domain-containing protein [bacterium]|nr:helix-turn-helix domain-containing protein [bacterium]
MLRFEKFPPDVKLRSYVHYYFVISHGSSNSLTHNHFHTNHPQGTFDLMFALSGGVRLENYKEEQFQLNQIFVMAQQEGYFNVKFDDNAHILGVVFYAESFSKLFNLPLTELTNSGCQLTDHLSSDYQNFYEQLHHFKNDQERIFALNKFIEKQLSKVDYSFDKMDVLIRSIRTGKASEKIEDLARASNMSERTLQRKLKANLGIGPKSFSKINRFKEVLVCISTHPEYDWQDLLYRFGYYDQAHFIKDFKRYTGKTPGEFLKSTDDLSQLFLEK